MDSMIVQNLQVQGLYPKDELALYLTLNNLKPASIVALTPEYISGKKGIIRDGFEGDLKITEAEKVELTDIEVQQFRCALVNQGFVFKKMWSYNEKNVNIYGQKIIINQEIYFVAKDRDNLEKLIAANESKDNFAIGRALGYPEVASKYYGQVYGDHVVNGVYKTQEMHNAIIAGKEIPSWLGYIWHVPVLLDITKGIYSLESEQQGKSYEVFTRFNNGALALKVDAKLRKEIESNRKRE